MEDELIAMFNRISTSDHNALVIQFSQIMKTDENVARFFLEAGSWSVEKAVHAYLTEFGDEQFSIAQASTPQVSFLSDLSAMQSMSFPPYHAIDMQWTFRNDGPEPWPEETRIVFVDGERMQGFQQVNLPPSVAPGQIVTVPQRLITPERTGTFAGTWRLVCPSGYFGDPIWIIIAVQDQGQGAPDSAFAAAAASRGDEEMEML